MAMLRDRTALVQAMDAGLSDLDALVLPTTPIVAPTIAEVSSSEGFTANNGLALRNPAIANFFDLCAISLPLPRSDALPVGLMLVARNGHDRRLFRVRLRWSAFFQPCEGIQLVLPQKQSGGSLSP